MARLRDGRSGAGAGGGGGRGGYLQQQYDTIQSCNQQTGRVCVSHHPVMRILTSNDVTAPVGQRVRAFDLDLG